MVMVSLQGKGTADIGTSKEHHLCLMDTSSSGNGLFAGDFFAELGYVESMSLHFPIMQFAVIFYLPHYIAWVASSLEIRGFKMTLSVKSFLD